jgi:hypothetical protein
MQVKIKIFFRKIKSVGTSGTRAKKAQKLKKNLKKKIE